MLVIRHRSLVICIFTHRTPPLLSTDNCSLLTDNWSLITGHWSLLAGRWSLLAGHWSLFKNCRNRSNPNV
jgi:hypothetical protein